VTVKTILVHFHDPARAERLLAATVPLARSHAAHLVLLAVMPPYVIIPASEGVGASVNVDEHRIAYRRDLDKLKARADDLSRDDTLSIEWREVDASFGTTAGTIIEHARASDLVVVAQRNADWNFSGLVEDPERIVIECGRPVLLVPNRGTIRSLARSALFAWNGSRESARAAFDAVPLLMRGAEVTVAWIDPPAAAAGAAGADLCTALARHGLKCEAAEIHTSDGGIGAALRREVAVRGGDLLVMGAYGHSRLREFVLGGASRDLFANVDRPVLMSH
jgi:nucleotide-binding universal stress UspA family protein